MYNHEKSGSLGLKAPIAGMSLAFVGDPLLLQGTKFLLEAGLINPNSAPSSLLHPLEIAVVTTENLVINAASHLTQTADQLNLLHYNDHLATSFFQVIGPALVLAGEAIPPERLGQSHENSLTHFLRLVHTITGMGASALTLPLLTQVPDIITNLQAATNIQESLPATDLALLGICVYGIFSILRGASRLHRTMNTSPHPSSSRLVRRSVPRSSVSISKEKPPSVTPPAPQRATLPGTENLDGEWAKAAHNQWLDTIPDYLTHLPKSGTKGDPTPGGLSEANDLLVWLKSYFRLLHKLQENNIPPDQYNPE